MQVAAVVPGARRTFENLGLDPIRFGTTPEPGCIHNQGRRHTPCIPMWWMSKVEASSLTAKSISCSYLWSSLVIETQPANILGKATALELIVKRKKKIKIKIVKQNEQTNKKDA